MFTGIVHHQGKITAIRAVDQGLQLSISTEFADLLSGESIAVDGACLTVISPERHQFDVQLSRETCEKTIANTYTVGAWVNLERAMSASDRFGGHYVTGHVEQVANLASIDPVGECVELEFSGIHPVYRAYLIEKGSVCVNGVSLTINTVLKDSFTVMLIPHTLDITNLKTLKKGMQVNIEFDWMVKVIVSQLRQKNRGEILCNE